MPHILVVDDEQSICWALDKLLTGRNYQVTSLSSAEDALQWTKQSEPDVVMMDVRLPGMTGLDALPQLRANVGATPIIIMTAFGNLDTTVAAIREGAFDYLPKPFDLDQATDMIERALEASQCIPAIDESPVRFEEEDALIGSSPAMQQIFKQIALVSSSDVPVLLTGESGTGKELVARAIHRHSGRQEKPFLPVCLAALSPGLVESELFGHVRGSFTGATHNRQGLLELAGTGTVLLDEIADCDVGLQVKLLRALEQREIMAVGDAQPRRFFARIIAATNRPIPQLIQSGEFREDLFFRLSVFHIELPPLRERLEDIPALAAYFLKRTRPSTESESLSKAVIEALQSRDWPGNIRELRNVIEHAAILARGQMLSPGHLSPPSQFLSAAVHGDLDDQIAQLIQHWVSENSTDTIDQDSSDLYERFLALVEEPMLKAVLSTCKDNRAAAASLLGMHRTTLRQKLRKREIE